MRFILQYVLAFFLFVFSSLASWYEGSALRDLPWEWKYSAIFSQMLHGSIKNSKDISQLDHFIYAAKFKPIFPILMVLSLIYLVTLTGYLLFRYNVKKLIVFYFVFGVLLFGLGAVVANSPTTGGRYFTVLFMAACLLYVLVSFLKLKNIRNA
ncbi:YjdJ family protein [Anoxybacteroides tepidamans]|uniref:YjdJ family protein n=1 Tax=Anoxybacteroides tepidamans TaxID=265948 RepID=UPI000486F34B|nr:YjdJ family protein [Anoxybacillus tepidamans]